MEEEPISPDKALWGITYGTIQSAIDSDDESQVDMEAMTQGDSTGLSLGELCDEVQRKVEETLDQMKDSLLADRGDVDLYLRLNDSLLAFQHWSDDIVVQNESPLTMIEQDPSGFKVVAMRLRACFNKMLEILARLQEDAKKASSKIKTKTDDQVSDVDQPIDELEQLINHLKSFVNPLRTLLEAKKNVGNIAAVRNAIATHRAKNTQKKPRATKRRSKAPRLANDISRCLKESYFDGPPRSFAPAGAIDELVVPAAVEAELGVTDPTGDHRELIDYIVAKAKNIFAIAIRVGLDGSNLYKAMVLFKTHEIGDTNLPIIHVSQELPAPKGSGESFTSEVDEDEDSEDDGESILTDIDPDEQVWYYGRRHQFYDFQWTFLAPVFSTGQINYDLHQKAILPFTLKDPDFKSGAFGHVFRVAIHEKHIQDPDNTFGKLPTYIAIKKIVPRTPDEQQAVALNWEKEAGNLRQVTQLKQKHIVRFITAFRRGDPGKQEHYLICEWADGGNLGEFWFSIHRPELSASLVKEATQQLRGLAEALCAAHYPGKYKPYIRHGDLKPENILLFKGEGIFGTLKMGDWGLAKEKNIATEFQVNRTSTGHGSVQYEAPEVRTGLLTNSGQRKMVRSRLYDVWAMGCIILEFIIWLLEGTQGLRQFHRDITARQNNAPYYQTLSVLGKDEAEVRKTVRDKMDSIAKNPACREGTALRDLLELVRKRLLVVRLPKTLGRLEVDNEQGSPRGHPMARSNTVDEQGSPRGQPMAQFTAIDRTELNEGDYLGPPKEPAVQNTAAGIAFEVTEHVFADEPAATEPEKHDEEEKEQGPSRALATELRDELEKMLSERGKNSSYWLTDNTTTAPNITLRESATPRVNEYSLGSGSGAPSSFDSSGTKFWDSTSTKVDTGASSVPSEGDSRKSDFLGVQKEQNIVSAGGPPDSGAQSDTDVI